VVKGERMLVFVDFLRRDLAAENAGEDVAVVVGRGGIDRHGRDSLPAQSQVKRNCSVIFGGCRCSFVENAFAQFIATTSLRFGRSAMEQVRWLGGAVACSVLAGA